MAKLTDAEVITEFIDEKVIEITFVCSCGDHIQLRLPDVSEVADRLRNHKC